MDAEARDALVKIVNEAGRQLATRTLDPDALAELIPEREDPDETALVPMSEMFKAGIPPEVSGPPLRSLPRITRASGGMFGFWVVGGEPGLGKTTLATQIMIEYARYAPVLYYDDENGRLVTANHIGAMYRGDAEKAAKATERVYYRESIRTLKQDLQEVKPPALLVVDSLQSLPTKQEFMAAGIQAWVVRFQKIAKRGYAVLAISEKPRSSYGEATLGGWKGSGSIEYKATFGVQLLRDEADDELVQVHVVKNRHRLHRGHVVNLRRDPERAWVFHEEPAGRRDMEDID